MGNEILKQYERSTYEIVGGIIGFLFAFIINLLYREVDSILNWQFLVLSIVFIFIGCVFGYLFNDGNNNERRKPKNN